MHNLILMAVCFVLGMALHASKKMPSNAPMTLNSFIIYVALPALTITAMRQLHYDSAFGLAALMAWLQFLVAALFVLLVGNALRLERGTRGALLLTAGLGNTAFFGLPMVETFFGKAALPTALVVDQLGSFLVVSTLGLFAAASYAGHKMTPKAALLRLVLFPPFWAMPIGIALRHVSCPTWCMLTLQRLGETLTPLAIFSIGFQLRLNHLAGLLRPLSLGLLYKLVLAPAVMLLIFVWLLGARGEVVAVTIFQAGMPPMVTGAILASQHHLDPPLANLMASLGLLASVFTLTLWHQIVLPLM